MHFTVTDYAPKYVSTVIAATRSYAEAIVLARMAVDPRDGSLLDKRLLAFRELIFASVCVTLLECRVPKDEVNRIMRTALSTSSGERSLKRMRYGVQWINRLVRELLQRGWGLKASSLFFICKNALSKRAFVT